MLECFNCFLSWVIARNPKNEVAIPSYFEEIASSYSSSRPQRNFCLLLTTHDLLNTEY
jgi:hypothetical protein